MLPRKTVEFLAHRSGLRDVLIAEREVILTYVLRLLSDTGHLTRYAFKGGTCIRKMHLGSTGRFSMDLDFTACDPQEPEDSILDFMEAFNGDFHGIRFRLDNDDHWRITQGGLSFTVHPSYTHDWNADGGFDLQVSLREQPTLDLVPAPLVEQPYFKELPFQVPTIPCLEQHEILSEKVRAAYQRVKVRDLHDLYVFSTKVPDRDLLRRLVVLKLWQANECFHPGNLFEKFRKSDYDWDDLYQLVRSAERIEPAEIIDCVISTYSFLAKLTEEEGSLAADGRAHRERDLKAKLAESCRNRKATGSF